MASLHISISAEPLFDLGAVTITNSIFTSWLVSGFLILFAIWFGTKLSKVSYMDKPGAFQSFIEFIIANLYDLVYGIAGTSKKAKAFFPLVATFFFFILFSNWSGLLPGVGTMGYRSFETEDHSQWTTPSFPQLAQAAEPVHQAAIETDSIENDSHSPTGSVTTKSNEGIFIPYFRAPTADLNTTMALALFSVISIQIIGVKFLNIAYFGKFLNFSSPIYFAVGILEILGEISRIISFAFRLFGNIFAGEVLLAVIAFLIPVALPIPFYGLEVFVGLIQALVFALLTLVFLNTATLGHGDEGHHT